MPSDYGGGLSHPVGREDNMPNIDTTADAVAALYAHMDAVLTRVRRRLNRRLGFAEKILLSHLEDATSRELARGTGSALNAAGTRRIS